MFGNVEYRKAMEGSSGQVVLSLIAKISKVACLPSIFVYRRIGRHNGTVDPFHTAGVESS